LRHHPLVLKFDFKKGVKRAEKANAIDNYITNQIADKVQFNSLFETIPPEFTSERSNEWIKQMSNVVVSSDAFFPFSDNIERVVRSGVQFVAAPAGSVMDKVVVECCDKNDILMCFTDKRLFHH
jgi:phosphoribosylaminoimidazolecarboxamide formyltransferase/IMP cyclohydrolase